ncbi:DUF1329 domain-containing protein [Pseudomonas sp. 2FG]|uniref:DUF1329 domain-containing protein n=1 Tax=Pseudomonas sp. 2FG TaxID=2502191 RepID=UPI0010F8F0E9|nr:DUF1329 domain-containing protein [Pseudomonas sp. 2FG]
MKRLMQSTSLSLSLLAGTALAAVTPEQAAQLGKTLTPLGAEQAGNADGSIPAWTGGLGKTSGKQSPEGFLDDPFASEQPLFTIEAKNAEQYKDKLSPGQLAMLKRYPDSYRMPVYPSHRSVALPDSVYAAVRSNALNTQLVEGGSGLTNFQTAYPFPIPQNGQEAVWNHLTRYRGGSMRRVSVQATPEQSGAFTPVKFEMEFVYRDQLKDFDPAKPGNVLFYYKEEVKSPARLAGSVLLVHETLNQVREPRLAWLYNAGQRRVRRAPQVAYDGPYPASEGQRVGDNFDMYNGAQDRYDWKLVGKRELYIPYNSFRLDSPKLKYDDIVQAGHLNPEFTRYELHRVWEVEANLKPGERHVYAKRVFFIDEDSWQIVLADHYDARGTLWRVGEGHLQPYYNAQVPWLAVETLHDLLNGRYIVSGMKNEESQGVEFGVKALAADYTPAALRNSGVR